MRVQSETCLTTISRNQTASQNVESSPPEKKKLPGDSSRDLFYIPVAGLLTFDPGRRKPSNLSQRLARCLFLYQKVDKLPKLPWIRNIRNSVGNSQGPGGQPPKNPWVGSINPLDPSRYTESDPRINLSAEGFRTQGENRQLFQSLQVSYVFC